MRVLVKFSGPISTAVGRRWTDLLKAESTALALLNRHVIPAAPCRILSGENRVFLESMRFDRIGVRGRRGMISLCPLLAAFNGGLDESWAAVAPRLATMGWISAEAAALMQRAHWFGVLIGNTDMHYGNVSVFLTEERPFELCPLYDTLPMRYRPSSTGDLPDGGLEAAGRPRLLPGPLDVIPWSEISQLAREFWREVAACDSGSSGFREIARSNEQAIQSLGAQINGILVVRRPSGGSFSFRRWGAVVMSPTDFNEKLLWHESTHPTANWPPATCSPKSPGAPANSLRPKATSP